MTFSFRVIQNNKWIKRAIKALGPGPMGRVNFKYGQKAAVYVGEHKLTNQVLNVKSGNLRRSLLAPSKGAKKRGNRVFVGTDLKYGRIHEYGGVIRPKNGKYLKFKVGGNFVSVTQVKMPKRPWLKPGLKEFKKSQRAKKLFADYVMAEVRRATA